MRETKLYAVDVDHKKQKLEAYEALQASKEQQAKIDELRKKRQARLDADSQNHKRAPLQRSNAPGAN